jgi:hypothetical protein
MVVIGNPNPKFTWGWNWNVGYKRFDLSMLLNGSYGGQIYRAVDMNLANIDGVFNVLSDVQNRWRSEQNPGQVNGRAPTLIISPGKLTRYMYTAAIICGSRISH